jgi:F0F1-type ATP synthase assembly protein I
MNPTTEATDANEPHSPRCDALEHEADVVKGKLLRTIERLDDKRHEAMETAIHVRNDLLIAGVVSGVIVGLLLGEIRLRSALRKRRSFWVRLRLATRG